MMSKKLAHPIIPIHPASQRSPLNLNVNYVTVMKYTYTYEILTKKVNEYDQEIPQSQTADNPVAP